MIFYDADEYEVVIDSGKCPFHEKNPGVSFAGCTCWGSVGYRRRTEDEITAIRAKKRREAEDRILRDAEAILARRRSAR